LIALCKAEATFSKHQQMVILLLNLGMRIIFHYAILLIGKQPNAYWSKLFLFLCVIGLMIVIRPPHNDNADDDKDVDDDDARRDF